MVAVLLGLLGGRALGQEAGPSAASPLSVRAQPDGRFLLTNTSAAPQIVTLNVTGNATANIRQEGVADGQCVPRARIPDTGPNNLPTLTLRPGGRICVWVKASATSAVPSTDGTQQLLWTVGTDADQVSGRVPLNQGTGVPVPVTPLAVPAEPALVRDTDDALATCTAPATFTSAAGRQAQACLDAQGALLGLQTAAAPDLYRNITLFTKEAKPVTATLVVRKPWWHAALAILAGLLLPPLLAFLAQRRREQEELKHRLAGLNIDPASPPLLVPSLGPGQTSPFRLDLDPNLLRARPSALQPMSDVRDAYTALGQWRELGPPRNLLGQLQAASAAARGRWARCCLPLRLSWTFWKSSGAASAWACR
ncbi:hypothetical protein [Deinococcus multiflagellatus]|uniref:Uncharacterized protein n=1 Tax=Deinococcus multiflagellatus TaxID=1656887 RepID=A0ABW1ZMS0_9DEIO